MSCFLFGFSQAKPGVSSFMNWHQNLMRCLSVFTVSLTSPGFAKLMAGLFTKPGHHWCTLPSVVPLVQVVMLPHGISKKSRGST